MVKIRHQKILKYLMNILIIPGGGIEHPVSPPQLRLLATIGLPAPALYIEKKLLVFYCF